MMCTRTPPSPRLSRATPPSPAFIQVGQKPQINSRGGASARKTNPTSEGRGLLLQSKKNQPYKQAQKCRLSTASTARVSSPSRKTEARGWQEERTTLVISQHADSESRQQRQPQRVLRCNQRAGGRETDTKKGRKVERAAKERYMSTYCRLVHRTACVSAFDLVRAQEGPGPTGKPQEERARRAFAAGAGGVPGSAGEERA
jgi:hypothetical protein